MNCAEEVFPVTRVHAGFAANRTVHHRQKRGWKLHVRNAAMKNRRHKPRDVTDYPTAKSHHERTPIESRRDHLVANRACLLKRFRVLAGSNSNKRRLQASCSESFTDLPTNQWCHIRIRNNCATLELQPFSHELACIRMQA